MRALPERLRGGLLGIDGLLGGLRFVAKVNHAHSGEESEEQ